MTVAWRPVQLGSLLRKAEEVVWPVADARYTEVTVRLWGRGVVPRGVVDGLQLVGQRRFRARPGQFIASRIDARNGALGVVPASLDGAIVTNDFPLFDVDPARLDPAFLGWLSRTESFVDLCRRASEGTTNRVRLKEERFLALEIALPTIDEQRRIRSRIEAIAGRIEEAKRLRGAAATAAEVVVAGLTTRIFDKLLRGNVAPIRALGPGGINPIQIGPFGAQLHSSEFTSTGVPVLNVGNVWPHGIRLERVDHVTHEKAAMLSRYTVQTGDLLFARSGATLGKVCLVPEECNGWLMTGHLFRVRFDPSRINNRFAFVGLRNARQVQERLFGQVRGATRPGYNTTLLGNIEIPVPPIEVQQRVVEEVDAMQGELNRLADEQRQSSTALSALVPAVLDKAFRGEL